VDALELLSGEQPFIADTSAWWRIAALPDDLGLLVDAAILADRLWLTPIVRMEILYSARTSSEYVELESELDADPPQRPRRGGRGDGSPRRVG
jgi:predicted nucleic acid-binding protein